MKPCRKCGSSDIPANRLARSDYRCRECMRADVRRRRETIPQKRAPRTDALRAIENERYRARYADPAERPKFDARSALRRAVKRGEIQKRPCEVCGTSKVEAHHDDYSKPFDVRWFCSKHHALHHKFLRQSQQA